jgi:hypothetical protein
VRSVRLASLLRLAAAATCIHSFRRPQRLLSVRSFRSFLGASCQQRGFLRSRRGCHSFVLSTINKLASRCSTSSTVDLFSVSSCRLTASDPRSTLSRHFYPAARRPAALTFVSLTRTRLPLSAEASTIVPPAFTYIEASMPADFSPSLTSDHVLTTMLSLHFFNSCLTFVKSLPSYPTFTDRIIPDDIT